MSAASAPLRLDSSACDRCGRCVAACKPKVLRIGPGYISVDWTACDACGKCASVCEAGAIRLRTAALHAVPEALQPVTGAPAAKGATAKSSSEPAKAAPRKRSTKASASASVSVWTLPEAALAIVVAFALLVGVQAFAAAAAGPPWSGIALVGYDVALLALLWYLARRHGVDPSAAYRIDRGPEVSTALLAVAVAVGCWVFSLTYRMAVLAIGLQPGSGEGADLTRLFGPGLPGAALTVLAVALIGPVLEELLLRGVVLGAVRDRFGDWPAIAVSAVAFAALHASLWSLLPLTVLGVGLGWLATRSRTLWPAIAAHVLYNGVLVAAALFTAAR